MSQERKIFTLIEVCESIRYTIAHRYGSAFWMKAEMHKLNKYEKSGHCFPELCQKQDNEIVAEIKSTLWKQDYLRIESTFIAETGEGLKEGVELLLQVFIKYEPKYGLSLHIIDIDPNFTIGQLRKQRLICVERLRKEQLWDKQKKLEFPLLPKRIAIISASTSKGYSDFMQIINREPSRFNFFTTLYTAVLQGESAAETIPQALKEIGEEIENYDVVVILRGGGAEVGLSVFDRYEIAASIAKFPIPVLTGIGHSTNLTVSEEVAFYNGITPTQVGDFLWNSFERFEEEIRNLGENIGTITQGVLEYNRRELEKLKGVYRIGLQICKHEALKLKNVDSNLQRSFQRKINYEKREIKEIGENISKNTRESLQYNSRELEKLKGVYRIGLQRYKYELQELKNVYSKLQQSFQRKINYEKREIEQTRKIIEEINPEKVLRRGYSLVYSGKKIVKDVLSIKKGQKIEIQFRSGKAGAEITEIKK